MLGQKKYKCLSHKTSQVIENRDKTPPPSWKEMGREYVEVVPADGAQQMLLMKNRNHILPYTFLSRIGMERRKLKAEGQTVE